MQPFKLLCALEQLGYGRVNINMGHDPRQECGRLHIRGVIGDTEYNYREAILDLDSDEVFIEDNEFKWVDVIFDRALLYFERARKDPSVRGG